MKTLIASAIAAALLIPGAAFAHADSYHDKKVEQQGVSNRETRADQRQVHRIAYRNFKAGERFQRARDADYHILAWHNYRLLNAPPHGYYWVRSGDNALLVRTNDHFIARIVYGMF